MSFKEVEVKPSNITDTVNVTWWNKHIRGVHRGWNSTEENFFNCCCILALDGLTPGKNHTVHAGCF